MKENAMELLNEHLINVEREANSALQRIEASGFKIDIDFIQYFQKMFNAWYFFFSLSKTFQNI